jgi:hypothetical protein
MTPREQAEGAWTPTSRFNVDELEDQIRADRGLPPLSRDQARVDRSVVPRPYRPPNRSGSQTSRHRTMNGMPVFQVIRRCVLMAAFSVAGG